VAASCKTSQVGTDSSCSLPIASFQLPRSGVRLGGNNVGKPDISAPGRLICAARWGASFETATACGPDFHYIAISGTSMATPHVAGGRGAGDPGQPGITPAGVKELLKNTAVDLGRGVTADDQGSGEVKPDPGPSDQPGGAGRPAVSDGPCRTDIDARDLQPELYGYPFESSLSVLTRFRERLYSRIDISAGQNICGPFRRPRRHLFSHRASRYGPRSREHPKRRTSS